MMVAKNRLKTAAAVTHEKLMGRVSAKQGCVPTFFDNFLSTLLNRLAATEAIHGWDPQGILR